MTKTRAARILSLILALTLVFASMSPSSYAMSRQQFGAWIAAALQAINITVSSTAAPIIGAGRDIADWLAVPQKTIASQFVDIPYTTDLGAIDDYLSRSTLEVDKDKVVIDGVSYSDVWLSTDAAEKFRVNAFDLADAFDIVNLEEGTFVSGIGNFRNIPMFKFPNGNVRSQNSTGLGLDGIQAELVDQQGTSSYKYKFYDNDVLYTERTLNQPITHFWFSAANERDHPSVQFSTGGIAIELKKFYSEDITLEPFDFDWVSGTIPTDESLTENEGLRIRVPTEDIADWYTDYPDTGDSVVINMGDPDLEAKVDDLIDLIIPLIPILDIDFTEKETPAPAPDPEPVPDPEPYPDPLPDPSISLIDSTLKDIVQALKNIYDSIATGNTFSEAIKNLNDKINWSLDDIKEKIGDLANKIETGSADWFRDIVQSIWQPFLPLFNIFRAGVGIWHYVVEWLQYIHEPFVTFWNFLSSAGYVFLSPIYATAAAAIVIAIYRRFGR